jgi:hypothetical protein
LACRAVPVIAISVFSPNFLCLSPYGLVMHKNKAVIAVTIVFACLALQQVHASRLALPPQQVSQPFVSDFQFGNDGINAYAPSYGTLTINLIDSTHASVSFASNTVAGHTYLFGGNNAFALQVNASSFTAGSFVGGRVGGFTGTLGLGGAQNMDGFGLFNFSIADSDGFKDAFDTLTFTLTNTSGIWGSASHVLSLNPKGFDAAGHVFIANLVNGKYVNLNVTGFAAEGPVSTPDGGMTVTLLGAALGVLGMARRFLKA